MPDEPQDRDVFGDMFGPLQADISQRLMQAMMRLPAVLEQQVEGEDGPVEIPPEQMAEALQSALLALMDAVPKLAGALDIARTRITQLERQVAELGHPGG